MTGAIARDIEANVSTEVLEQWRVRVLSCTGSFSVHTTAGRLQASMQLREKFAKRPRSHEPYTIAKNI